MKPQGLVLTEELGKLIKLHYLIGSRTRELPACCIAPQSLHYVMPSCGKCVTITIPDVIHTNKTFRRLDSFSVLRWY
jgi:hypothetical protein